MKAFIFFLLGAMFVVVGEWVYLNLINRSAGVSLTKKPSADGDNSHVGHEQLPSGGSAATNGNVVADVTSTQQAAAATPVAGSGRTVIQAVSKGRAFLDRMAAKEASEAGQVSTTYAGTDTAQSVKSDKTSLTATRALAKQHDGGMADSVAGADDLERVSGIGPKIAELLAANGIDSFAALAAANQETLQTVLASAGPRYALADVSTWAPQARALLESK